LFQPIPVKKPAVPSAVAYRCFLRMSASSAQRWSAMAFGWTVLTAVILIVGSLWIMHNVRVDMAFRSIPVPLEIRFAAPSVDGLFGAAELRCKDAGEATGA
jgi:hypothetical protein